MMRTIVFDDNIDTKSVRKLIDEIEEKTKDDKNITIYFCTNGGGFQEGCVLADYINNSDLNIIFIGWWSINSTGFNIFFKLTCKRKLIDVHAVLHLGSREVDTIEMSKNKSYDRFLIEEMDKGNHLKIKFYLSLGITNDEISEISAGEDVYINNDRLNEMLKIQERGNDG